MSGALPGLDPTLDGPLHRQAQVLRARLEAAFPPRLFAHDHVPARLTPTVWSQLTRRKPFVGLGFTAIRPDANSGRILGSRAAWDVFLVASNPRPAERLLGDRQGPGVAGMLQVAIYALHGLTIGGAGTGEASGTVEVTGADHSYFEGEADDQTALVRLSLSIPTHWRPDLPIEEFLRTRVVWDFPVAGAVTDDTTVRTP